MSDDTMGSLPNIVLLINEVSLDCCIVCISLYKHKEHKNYKNQNTITSLYYFSYVHEVRPSTWWTKGTYCEWGCFVIFPSTKETNFRHNSWKIHLKIFRDSINNYIFKCSLSHRAHFMYWSIIKYKIIKRYNAELFVTVVKLLILIKITLFLTLQLLKNFTIQ